MKSNELCIEIEDFINKPNPNLEICERLAEVRVVSILFGDHSYFGELTRNPKIPVLLHYSKLIWNDYNYEYPFAVIFKWYNKFDTPIKRTFDFKIPCNIHHHFNLEFN